MLRLDKQRLSWLGSLAAQYESSLDDQTLSYLNGRGITPEVAAEYRLGTVADPPTEHRNYRGRLVIPYLKKVGVTGFKFRCVRPECSKAGRCEGHDKYYSDGVSQMYNVGAVDRATGFIALCEGEIDAITLDGWCDIPTIGPPGVSNWKNNPHWARLLKDFRSIYMFADNDPGEKNHGREFGEKIRQTLSQTVIIELPEDPEPNPELKRGMDANRAYGLWGRDFLRGLIM